MALQQFPCKQCGADLKFNPGAETLKCPYCGTENDIPKSDEKIEELDFNAYLNQAMQAQDMYEVQTVKCNACGAETTVEKNVTASECPFCGTSLVMTLQTQKLIKPRSLLPFKVTVQEAHDKFVKWVKSRWFAPNALKKEARREGGLQGMYTPYWTYDTNTTTNYTGERGENYTVTETYQTTENGKRVTKTRQVTKIRWYPARGRVQNDFDDVLVVASDSLPRKYAQALEPWDLNALVPYSDEYLSGFRSESYEVDLKQGFELAKQIMDRTIDSTIRQDIGGDHQRIHTKNTSYANITFKHVLLPVWISAYRYGGKVYRFLVNARTGEVQGERPWSWIKITLASLVAAGIIGGIIYVIQYYQ
jgi:predicted RNA-binding Zn-ribbon protein involved in translation (DUF1610 family)